MIIPRDALPPPPDGEPTAVDAIALDFDPPQGCWFDARLVLPGQVEPLFLSDVFDPFPPMLDWLRRIARGEAACLSIDQEGDVFDLAAEPAAAPGIVRLTAWADELKGDDFEHRLAFDIQIPARTLIAALYGDVLAIWEQPDPDTFWRRWHWIDNKDSPPGAPCYRYDVRDAEIEAFLNGAP